MQELVIGNTIIEYSIRESEKAKLKRIIIKPETIEIVVPKGTPSLNINNFVERHKKRIYTKRTEQLQKISGRKEEKPSEYVSGVKILHYGRLMGVVAERQNIPAVLIEAKSRIHLHVPIHSSDGEVRNEIEKWQRNQILKDATGLVEHYGNKLNLFPKSIRVKEQKHLWASCGKDKIINLNWKLVKFPKAVLEYVIVHELCHLKYRNHSKEFWRLVGSVYSDWQTCKKMLEG